MGGEFGLWQVQSKRRYGLGKTSTEIKATMKFRSYLFNYLMLYGRKKKNIRAFKGIEQSFDRIKEIWFQI